MSSYILVKRFGILAGLLLLSCCRNAGTRAEAVRPSLSPNIFCLDSACRTYRTIPFVRRKVKWGFACLGNVPPGTTMNPRLPPIEYAAEDVGKPGFPKLTRYELVALRELRRVDDSPQLRIAWVDGPDGPNSEFIIFDETGEPCNGNAGGYRVLNGRCNEFYEPGENPYETRAANGCYGTK